MKQFFVYVLRSTKNGRRYIGSTQDVGTRLALHNAGNSKSTRAGRPRNVIRVEHYKTRSEAGLRERFLKTGKGREEPGHRLD